MGRKSRKKRGFQMKAFITFTVKIYKFHILEKNVQNIFCCSQLKKGERIYIELLGCTDLTYFNTVWKDIHKLDPVLHTTDILLQTYPINFIELLEYCLHNLIGKIFTFKCISLTIFTKQSPGRSTVLDIWRKQKNSSYSTHFGCRT